MGFSGHFSNINVFNQQEFIITGSLILVLDFNPVLDSETVFLNGIEKSKFQDQYSLINKTLTIKTDAKAQIGDRIKIIYTRQ